MITSKLYGVRPGGQQVTESTILIGPLNAHTDYGSMPPIRLSLKSPPKQTFYPPCKDLISELKKQPAGTKVGIWAHSKLNLNVPVDDSENIAYIHGSQIQSDPFEFNYLKEISDTATSCGLKIVCLGDYNTFVKAVQNVVLQQKQVHVMTSGHSIKENAGLARSLYELQIETDYINTIETCRGLIKNISEEKPEIVILLRGQAATISSEDALIRREMSQSGIQFEEYFIEEGDGNATSLIKAPPIPDIDLAYPDTTIRRRNAIKKNRILPEETPRYIGIREHNALTGGLEIFEIHVSNQKGENFTGTFQDELGCGSVEGKIDEKKIEFYVNYNKRAIISGAPQEEVTYYAELKADDIFQGRFGTFSDSGGFNIQEFDETAWVKNMLAK